VGSILLIIIYLAFISLGLPDSVLGVTIPSLQSEWAISLGAGGVISMVVIGGTIISSFFSAPVIKKLGTGKITFLSSLMTGAALMGISFAPSYPWMLLMAIPLGLGGGTVDTALNNYIALNYQARHMNWLHSFWGIGATLGPLAMSWALLSSGSWRVGYRGISIVQFSLAFILLMSLSLWRIKPTAKVEKKVPDDPSVITRGETGISKIPGVGMAFATMLFYCATEAGLGLLGSSYLVQSRGMAIEKAAMWMSMYFGGITVGRFLSGIITMKLNNTQMIRYGILTAIAGIVLLILPLPSFYIGPAFVFIGLGLSPVFPAMLHETPRRFGVESSQKIIGFQMGFGYVGSALIPPFVAVILQTTGTGPFPLIILTFTVVMFISSERLSRTVANRQAGRQHQGHS
jgi:fucose permease